MSASQSVQPLASPPAALRPRGFLTPVNFNEAQRIAQWLSGMGNMIPKDYRDNPNAIILAMQLGAEVGLSPMQALQNIAVIGNRPSIWGDAMLALVQGSGLLEDIQETWDNGSETARCKVKRRGQSTHISEYSMEKARRAGLLNKESFAWRSYPDRMCQMRARSFALRNTFPDVLMGLGSLPLADEGQVRDITPVPETLIAAEPVEESPPVEKEKKKEKEVVEVEEEPLDESKNAAANLALAAIVQRIKRASRRETLLALKNDIEQLPKSHFMTGLKVYNDRIQALKSASQERRKGDSE